MGPTKYSLHGVITRFAPESNITGKEDDVVVLILSNGVGIPPLASVS